ncbi:cobalt-precorrin 5A hydrolase [Rhizobium sp. SG_E_25_P2]|uniref:cobalamin biosynthesis protein n=1 Tax=Rhizobium sp. SG_E_25_P2 TaxID=2879942 RepID=UPI0024752DDB|nr:cobalamin biosynthesis protein [Rhizobium sp. SG_E_25_P2]MDH6267283.1 cobalt-precorrin 5A hydrolase [Rhizobium sp. SG_E_25_P2]
MAARLWLGFGLSEAAAAGDAVDAIAELFSELGLTPADLAGVSTIDRRADHPAVGRVETLFGRPVMLFSAERLERETPRLKKPSETIFRLMGCHGVAEAAALALAGEGAELLIEKRLMRRVTLALARSFD